MSMRDMVIECIPLGVELSTAEIATMVYGEDKGVYSVSRIYKVMKWLEKWGQASSRESAVDGRKVILWTRI